MLGDISGVTTKAPCEVALIGERHVRIEISDFVMRTFVLYAGNIARRLFRNHDKRTLRRFPCGVLQGMKRRFSVKNRESKRYLRLRGLCRRCMPLQDEDTENRAKTKDGRGGQQSYEPCF